MQRSMRRCLTGLCATLLCTSAVIAPAATAIAAYPDKPIRIIVPFSAGGGTDVLARSMSEVMSKSLKQTIVIENRPGAGTIIGNDYVSKSGPDGYTLLLTTSAFSIVPSLASRLPYAGANAFAPVALLGRAPNMLLVRSDSNLRTTADVLAAARKDPGRLNYGSSGIGTTTHLAAELLKNSANIDMVHVPYKGFSVLLTDLIGGQVDMAFATLPSAVQALDSGKVRAIAVTSVQRSPAWPDVPSISETGLPEYQADVWYGVFAPAGTPAAIVTLLNTEINRAMKSELVQKRMANEGLVISAEQPSTLGLLASTEETRWKRVVVQQRIAPQ